MGNVLLYFPEANFKIFWGAGGNLSTFLKSDINMKITVLIQKKTTCELHRCVYDNKIQKKKTKIHTLCGCGTSTFTMAWNENNKLLLAQKLHF